MHEVEHLPKSNGDGDELMIWVNPVENEKEEEKEVLHIKIFEDNLPYYGDTLRKFLGVAQEARRNGNLAKTKWLLDYHWVHSSKHDFSESTLYLWQLYAYACKNLKQFNRALLVLDLCLSHLPEHPRLIKQRERIRLASKAAIKQDLECDDKRILSLAQRVLPSYSEIDAPVIITVVYSYEDWLLKAGEYKGWDGITTPKDSRTAFATADVNENECRVALRMDNLERYSDDAIVGLLAHEFGHWALRWHYDFFSMTKNLDVEMRKYAADEIHRIIMLNEAEFHFDGSELLTDILAVTKGFGYELDCLRTKAGKYAIRDNESRGLPIHNIRSFWRIFVDKK